MVNAEIRTLREADGTPVCNVSFDLSAAQLSAAALAVDAVRIRRHRGRELTTDEALALREMTAVSDELHRLAEQEAHANLVLPLARFSLLHDALVEWVQEVEGRGWMRDEESAALPVLREMLEPMRELRAKALRAVLGAECHAHRS
jgi:hypothetical protein